MKLLHTFSGQHATIRIYQVDSDEAGDDFYEWEATLTAGQEIALSKQGHLSPDWALLEALNEILYNEEYD